jgi:DnaD/phage-associated family protein
MVERGMLLHLTLIKAGNSPFSKGGFRGIRKPFPPNRENEQKESYFLNTEADREVMEMMQTGELSPEEAISETVGKPNVFTMYEQNIGMLSPMIAEELKEAEKLYPASWIEDAFREAVSLNKRSWRYIAKILERWSSEGKGYGKPGKYPEKRTDPDKYIRGKYGHIVRR